MNPANESVGACRDLGIKVAVIVPCFNEAARWNLQYWRDIIEQGEYHLIFVDDGSKDSTWSIISGLSYYPNVSLLRLESNVGKAEAVRNGFLQGFTKFPTLDFIAFVDADPSVMAIEIFRILKLAVELEKESMKYDYIWGSRISLSGRSINRSLSRHVLGRLVSLILSIGSKDLPYDTQCGLKVFRCNDNLKVGLQTPFKTRWFFEMELLYRMNSNKVEIGSKIWEEPLMSWHSVEGSKIGFRESLRIIKEIIEIKKIQLSQ